MSKTNNGDPSKKTAGKTAASTKDTQNPAASNPQQPDPTPAPAQDSAATKADTDDTPPAPAATVPAGDSPDQSAEKKSQTGAAAPAHKGSTRAAKSKPLTRTPWWLVLLVLLTMAACAALAYLGWQELRLLEKQQQQRQQQLLQTLDERLQQQSSDTRQTLAQVAQSQKQDEQQWQTGLQALEQQVQQHGRRLQSLSTTSREDWLLAEAEYLMRLANQRLLMERGTSGALALLQSADQILVQVDDMKLFGVRDKLARDIATLKVAPDLDRTGLYLELAALGEQIQKLPDMPQLLKPEAASSRQQAPDKPAAPEADLATTASGWWAQLVEHFNSALSTLKHQVRIRHHDQPMQPLLPPDGSGYLRQNLRFNLEQAQLAMLREEPTIYRHSLDEAETLLRRYFANQETAQTLADAVQLLKQKRVEVQLPDISASLIALQDYITELHLLDERAGRPQLQADPASGGTP